MELDKKKYKTEEVREIILTNNTSYEEKLAEQKSRILELIEENQKLRAELEKLKNKENLVNSALITAEKTAKDKKEKSELEYKLIREKLTKFSMRWNVYFDELRAKYPLYSATKEADDIFNALNKLLKVKDNKTLVNDLDKKLEGKVNDNKIFDPEKRIADYVSATSENGFNLEEVLNPGELHLEDLCKELGLIEED